MRIRLECKCGDAVEIEHDANDAAVRDEATRFERKHAGCTLALITDANGNCLNVIRAPSYVPVPNT